MKTGMIWTALFLYCGTFSTGFAAKVLDRSVLTVGGDVYSASDFSLILAVWNELNTQKVPATTDMNSIKLTTFSLGEIPLVSVSKWPRDVQTFFFCALAYREATKTNLFALTESEYEAAKKKIDSSKLFGSAPTARLWKQLKEDEQKHYIDVVYRSLTFARIRGPLERNKNLMTVSWFWHETGN